jgi:murein DD-endopeptidase MepM/ murein hydrolase activator NlpD
MLVLGGRGRIAAVVVAALIGAVTAPAPTIAAPAEAPSPSAAPEITLSTIPTHVYKVPDSLDTKEKGECWYFHVVVRDARGRALEPQSATIRMLAGTSERASLTLGSDALKSLSGTTFIKNAGLEEAFDVRHHVCEPASLKIDRLAYTLEIGEAPSASVPQPKAAGRQPVRLTLDIPLAPYTQRVKLAFPLKGNFVVANGRVTEGGHHEWSQNFAYDILALGPMLNALLREGTANADFAGWGREVLAPAGGTVAYARNDVPDNPGMDAADLNRLAGLPDQPWPVAGNVVVIDHGTGEFSLLAHMQQGSVRVKKGDRVEPGQVLGLLGNSGNSSGPHLHYHLMDGPLLFKSNSLPSHFENIDGGTPAQGEMLEAK